MKKIRIGNVDSPVTSYNTFNLSGMSREQWTLIQQGQIWSQDDEELQPKHKQKSLVLIV